MSAAAGSPIAGHFACRIPDANIEISVNPDVIDRLGAAVREGFKAAPRRALPDVKNSTL
jgi:hypothetical protein